MSKQTFYSNGKLLITGEYVVLDGSRALALPTHFGQNLRVSPQKEDIIHWISKDYDGTVWFETRIDKETIRTGKKEIITAASSVESTLIEILHQAYLLNPRYLEQTGGFLIQTELTFPREWGLGSSSTLINNIAQWTKTDAFRLLKNSFGGSGYDIACAQNNTPILYQIRDTLPPIVTPVIFSPDFSNQLYFVYLNKKQSSRAAITSYFEKRQNISKTIQKIDKLTEIIINTREAAVFAKTLETHEAIMSDILEMNTVKEALFPDFNGVVKSLGAWGGDFVLAMASENPTGYFNRKGFHTVLSFKEMIL